jgi:UDP-2,3-diacylglucosamine hydrolase
MTDPIYFLSDVHLGADSPEAEVERERDLLAFLEEIEPSATFYLLGDVFDFWFDYSGPPPSRYAAVLEALARLAERGVRVCFMGGNHDYWARTRPGPGYLERELGLEILDDPHTAVHHGLRLLLTHGDALGGARGGYRIVRSLLRSRFTIFLYRLLPPRLGYAIARVASRTSRGREVESLLERYRIELRETAVGQLADGTHDAIIAGHVHHPERLEIDGRLYVNLGAWMVHRTFGLLRAGNLTVETYSRPGEA